MPLTIYKQLLEVKDVQTFLLPKGAAILSVQNQDGQLVLWYSFDTSETRKIPRSIEIWYTGEGMEIKNRIYITTIQRGPWVYHV
jgi:hypothetical protein